MSTLIVPCAGRSTRFPGMSPKWLLRYPDGKIMLEKSIEGLDVNFFDDVIITIVKEHAEKFSADKILENIFHFKNSTKFHLCVLENFTSCQAETVSKTLELCGVKGNFAVKDSDNYIKISIPITDNRNFVTGINIETFPNEIRRLNSKSFLTVNEQGIILDIIEKKRFCRCRDFLQCLSSFKFHKRSIQRNLSQSHNFISYRYEASGLPLLGS